jgi:hypothetical protein
VTRWGRSPQLADPGKDAEFTDLPSLRRDRALEIRDLDKYPSQWQTPLTLGELAMIAAR